MSFLLCLKLFLIAQKINWQKQEEDELYTAIFKENVMKIKWKIKNLLLKTPSMGVVHKPVPVTE